MAGAEQDGKLDPGGPLILVGCGKMGAALLDGWLTRGASAQDITVVEPNDDSAAPFVARGLLHVHSLDRLSASVAPAVIVLAVKPQQMDGVIEVCAGVTGPGTLVLSIAAGSTIGYFEDRLGGAAAIVRAMPNTPAAVGCGMTVLCANGVVSPAQRALASTLMTAVGEVAWVEDEALLDAVTAVSGGGPAYVFLLVECLAKAGVASGLPSGLSVQIARATVAGAGELIRQSDLPASRLRENVASPAGTTVEALQVLMAPDGLQALMDRAIAAATRRSRELAS